MLQTVEIKQKLSQVCRSVVPGRNDMLLSQVTALVALMKAHMRKWLPDILQLIADFWSPTSPLLPHLLKLLSELAGAACSCTCFLVVCVTTGCVIFGVVDACIGAVGFDSPSMVHHTFSAKASAATAAYGNAILSKPVIGLCILQDAYLYSQWHFGTTSAHTFPGCCQSLWRCLGRPSVAADMIWCGQHWHAWKRWALPWKTIWPFCCPPLSGSYTRVSEAVRAVPPRDTLIRLTNSHAGLLRIHGVGLLVKTCPLRLERSRTQNVQPRRQD